MAILRVSDCTLGPLMEILWGPYVVVRNKYPCLLSVWQVFYPLYYLSSLTSEGLYVQIVLQTL